MNMLRQWSLHIVQPAMCRALSLFIWLVMASLFAGLVLTWSVQAQTITPIPTPSPLSPRDTLKQAIQQRARHDVDMGKPPENASGLQVLFSEETTTVGMPMREVVEIYETAYQAAKSAKSPLDKLKDLLRPDVVGWIVAAILLVLLVLRNIITDYLTRFFKWLGEAIYRHVAGYKLFWGIALRRYRKALERHYQELKLIFRPDRPLQMQDVYVPLRVAGSGSQDLVDAYQAIQTHQWLVVVGAPGSGKTMLMSHLTLTYARQGLRDFPDQPVPVLLQLSRLNESESSLIELLGDVLERHNFPNGERFIRASLKHGRLLLLFDGLDEVNSERRGKVAGQIRDLLRQYPNNRAIVTCRTQVYKEELVDWANQTLEITEFSDQQIQHFLNAWEPDMPEDKSIEHFLRTLHERPQIMALARNPLLLTMIAYLYTDTEFALPHSRAEFYDRSTNLLLEQWKYERNRYKVSQKRLVLQHLALFNQERAKRTGGDRRTITLPVALEQICAVLPSLTLDEKDAQPMLDEIVERSGLLLEVDGGIRYQFTHLTLQEFFAARALEAEPDTLLAHFAEDRDAWREVLRLWCGLEHDSTALIRQLYQVEPVMAFECLGDAQQVETSYVTELVNTFQGRLVEAADDENLARAFALVAADPRHRGEALFDFLKNSLKTPALCLPAAAVLAFTNLPKAADALTEIAADDPDIRPYLIRMGDLAAPALAAWARQQQEWALDALHEVGTPQAALALVPLLWHDDTSLPYQAAWRLAALLHRPNVETALRTFELTPEQRNAEQIDWIWAPFNEPPDSAMPMIAGRIAYLLHMAPEEASPTGPPPSFDPRLVIPLCTVVAQDGQLEKIDGKKREELIKEADQLVAALSVEGSNQLMSDRNFHNAFIAKHVDKISTRPIWRHLFSSLPEMVQFKLLHSLFQKEPIPNIDDWRNVLRPSSYVFETSWQARSVNWLLIVLGLLNIWGLVNVVRQRPLMWNWENGLTLFAGIGIIIMIVLLGVGRIKLSLDAITGTILFPALGLVVALGIIFKLLSGNWLLGVGGGGVGGGVGVFSGVLGVLVLGGSLSGGGGGLVGGGVLGVVLGGILGGVLGGILDVGGDVVLVVLVLALLGGVLGVLGGVLGSLVLGGVSARLSGGGGLSGGVVLGSGVLGGVGGLVLGGVLDFHDGLSLVVLVIGFFFVVLGVGSVLVRLGVSISGALAGFFYGGVGLFFAFGGFLGGGISDCVLFYLPSRLVYDTWNWPGVALFLGGYLTMLVFLVWDANRQQRRAQNPLHGLLDEQDIATARPYRRMPFARWLRRRRS